MKKYHHTFTLERTNYSVKVITDQANYLFGNSSGSKTAFFAFQKIKRDIAKSGLTTPEISALDVKYFWFDDRDYPDSFTSVDINSAYPTVLRNVGAITEETYHYLTHEIGKMDRLRATGMLATTKSIYQFEDGEMVSQSVEKSPLAGWFFMCCVVTSDIMELCRLRYPETTLHFWVDGIAMSDYAMDAMMYIEHLGYQCKLEHITNCNKRGSWLHYNKNGKYKMLPLPTKQQITNSDVLDFLHGDDQ